jgi:hypothetical protein
MDVQVGIETQGPPTAERLEILRKAAAQYKVIDEIAKGFKMNIWDFDD